MRVLKSNLSFVSVFVLALSGCNSDKINIPVTYSNYSLFDDYVEPNLVTRHTMRLVNATRNPDVNVGKYIFNEKGKVTQRAYLDGTYNYTYNLDGTLKTASSLIDPEGSMIIQHTKENFISEYTYFNGRVVSEIKKVFPSTAMNLDGVPEVTYTIVYLYNDKNQLVQRHQYSKESPLSVVYDYTFNAEGRLSKIDEIKSKNDAVTNRDSLSLTYDKDGEITKAIHKRKALEADGGKEIVVQTVDISYFSNGELAYPFYYVDPVKEWRIDRDFFALSYFPIKEITTKKGNESTNITYEYRDKNLDSFPESFTSTMTVSDGNPSNTLTKQLTYTMEYANFSKSSAPTN